MLTFQHMCCSLCYLLVFPPPPLEACCLLVCVFQAFCAGKVMFECMCFRQRCDFGVLSFPGMWHMFGFSPGCFPIALFACGFPHSGAAELSQST